MSKPSIRDDDELIQKFYKPHKSMLFMRIQTVYSPLPPNPINKLYGVCWDIYLIQNSGTNSVQLIQPLCLPSGFLLKVLPIMLCILNFLLSYKSLTQIITSEMYTSQSFSRSL